jgi:hypothetical protein
VMGITLGTLGMLGKLSTSDQYPEFLA